MPRVSPPPRPPGPPPRRPDPKRGDPQRRVEQVLGEPRDVRDRPRGWKLALRRQRRRVRPILYGATALAVLVGVGLVAAASNHAANLTGLRQRFGAAGTLLGLRVRQVVVQGRTTTPEPLLDAAIGIAPGDPLLGYSVADARARLTTLASISEATVERRWPATILVSLVERHPFAVWQNHGHFVLIARDGSVLADQDVRLAGQLPLVVGGPDAPPRAAALLDELAGHPAILSHMVAAVRVGDRRWNLSMTSGANVLLPQDDEAAALGRLDALQAGHQLLDRKLQVIDLRLPDRTTLRPDAATSPVAATPAPAAPAPVQGVLTPAGTPRRPT